MRLRTLVASTGLAALVAACGGDTIVGSDDGADVEAEATVTTAATSTSPSPVPTTTTTRTTSPTTTTTRPAPDTTVRADGPEAESPSQGGEVPPELIDMVLQDASGRLGTGDLEVTTAELVEWPDSSLGCPEPGVLFTQVVTPGYRVVVAGGGATLDYRLTVDGTFRICDRPTTSPRSGDS